MAQPHVAPYGSWKSPITSDLIVSATVGLGQVVLDGADTYWVELRPSEGGRNCIVRRTPDGTISDVTPQGFNARTRVHEYGGGDFAVRDGAVYFTNFADQRVYRQRTETAPQPLTPEGKFRYSDFVMDWRHDRLYAVREDHTGEGAEAVNTLVVLGTEGASGEDGGRVIASGNDFYSTPRLSPDGTRLAWLTWGHPNMPWDGSELWVAALNADGTPGEPRRVAGGAEESIFQPEWSPGGALYFVSDRNNWWNLYRLNEDGGTEAVYEAEAEFGLPQWLFAMSTYAFASDELLVCASARRGDWSLGLLDTRRKSLEGVELPYTDITYVRADPTRAVFRAGSPTARAALVELDLETRAATVLRRRPRLLLDPARRRVPDRGRAHRARLLLPAAQPRLRRARGRAPAAPRQVPRRADLLGLLDAAAGDAVLDEPRHRRPRRELRREHGLRARVPAAAQRRVGRGGRGRLRQRRAAPHRAGRG
jgi:hypothetical protein